MYFFHLLTGRVSSAVCSSCVSSIDVGGGVVAMVQPIQAPMPRTVTKATSTGMATSQSRMASLMFRKASSNVPFEWLLHKI